MEVQSTKGKAAVKIITLKMEQDKRLNSNIHSGLIFLYLGIKLLVYIITFLNRPHRQNHSSDDSNISLSPKPQDMYNQSISHQQHRKYYSWHGDEDQSKVEEHEMVSLTQAELV